MYKMYLLSTERYESARAYILKIKRTEEIWVSMKNVHDCFGVKSISDLIFKEVYGRYGTKNLTKEQIKRYKMTERKIYQKYGSSSRDELNKMHQKISLREN